MIDEYEIFQYQIGGEGVGRLVTIVGQIPKMCIFVFMPFLSIQHLSAVIQLSLFLQTVLFTRPHSQKFEQSHGHNDLMNYYNFLNTKMVFYVNFMMIVFLFVLG